MNWTETPAMHRLEQFLDLVALRHELISSNLANIDTPGYRTRDVDFSSALRRAGQWAEAGFEAGPAPARVREVRGLIERPDGNNVSLERETVALARVQLLYRAAIELYRNEVHTLQSAINEGK